VTTGDSLIECSFDGDTLTCTSSSGRAVRREVSDRIGECMRDLSLVYSNAVFQDVASIEDCGMAFTHIHTFEMADPKYRHPRNKALVYTVGPNGNKPRYPNDVHVLPSVELWLKRMDLVGRNVVRSVALYNQHARTRSAASLQEITILRTPLIGGGAFLLRDEQDASKQLVQLDQHACAYEKGMVQEFLNAGDQGIRRIEFMHTKGKPDEPEVFQAGAEMALPKPGERDQGICCGCQSQ